MNVENTRRGSVELSPDRVYEILAHKYRRHTLCILHSRPGAVETDELAALVAARSRDIPVSDVDEDARDAVLVELHHNHLPRLRAAGLVSYNPGTSNTVELDGDIQPLLPSLRASGGNVREYHVD